MDRTSLYYRQVQLLLKILPLISQHSCFALKGGTAINLFIRELPRLSIDIDLVFLPSLERTEALTTIKKTLDDIAAEIGIKLVGCSVVRSYEDKNDALRLTVTRSGVQIKIELSPVLRGTVYESEILQVSESVEDEFGFTEMKVVSFADLYAGKICAALDRQHPRDLFDVKFLLENEGITQELRKALLIYLISHPRPLAELLQPQLKDISSIYDGEFRHMAERDVSLKELEETRVQLINIINTSLTIEERNFLLSFKNLQPNWGLLDLDRVDQLPAVRWKLKNLSTMSAAKHAAALRKLESVLQIV
ncbi:nucleotidyl transferase AbiEii/AbiGii toxin family protein [Pantoea sp. NPDC088449]|uniref:nucleotidyl transferase AbiEii/AbiGii toxin family protein n=1 Tax=unclassified Pantoea TaxID=2630326 RepID=UPI0031F59A15